MFRNISLLVSILLAQASPAALASSQQSSAAASVSLSATASAEHRARHLTRVSARKADMAAAKSGKRELVAIAPVEAGLGRWSAAGMPLETETPLIQDTPAKDEGPLNVWGMLAAALGIGVLSIVRRIERY